MAARACVSTQGAAAFTQRLMVVRLHFPNLCCPYQSEALNTKSRLLTDIGGAQHIPPNPRTNKGARSPRCW